jgi:hypothetical protein
VAAVSGCRGISIPLDVAYYAIHRAVSPSREGIRTPIAYDWTLRSEASFFIVAALGEDAE